MAKAAPRIVLVADLGEAGSAEGCGLIIHAVRDARARGVPVEELAPGSPSPLISRYRILTAPTVLVLTAEGKVLARYEGESPAVVASVQSGLANLPAA